MVVVKSAIRRVDKVRRDDWKLRFMHSSPKLVGLPPSRGVLAREDRAAHLTALCRQH